MIINPEILKVLFFIVAIVTALVRMKTGYRRGLISECSVMLSIAVSLLSIFLLLMLHSAVKGKTYGTVVVVTVALILIGVAYKFIRLIISLLKGISNIGIVGALDQLLGALFGLVEAFIIIFFLYKVLAYFGYNVPL